jgi:hypothetical protein
MIATKITRPKRYSRNGRRQLMSPRKPLSGKIAKEHSIAIAKCRPIHLARAAPVSRVLTSVIAIT